MKNNQKNSLPTEFTKNKNVQLHNSGSVEVGSIIDTALSQLTPEQRQSLMGKASEEALRLEIESRERSLDYMYGRKTIEDHVETFNMLDKQNNLTRHVVKSEIKTGAGTMRIESKAGKTCFVATATYGCVDHPDVVLLRQFRDTILRKTHLGKIFIDIYWIIGPYLASIVKSSNSLRKVSKWFLIKIVNHIQRKYFIDKKLF